MKRISLILAICGLMLAAGFTVILKEIGPHKVKVIKVLRTHLGIELKEAFDMLETVPVVLKENASEEEMQSLKAELEALGATLEIIEKSEE